MFHVFSDQHRHSSYGTMVQAIRDDDVVHVKFLLALRGFGYYCSYLLLWGALKYRRKDVAKFLLSQGAEVNMGDPPSSQCPEVNSSWADDTVPETVELTPLHLAVHLGDEQIVELVLEKGAWTEKLAGPELSTPLYDAVRYNKLKIIELLLKYGANANTPGSDGKTPLMIAAGYRNVTVTKLLLDHGADANSALASAVEGGKVEIVKLLLNRGADIDKKSGASGSTLLHIAAANRHGQLVDFLLKRGADVNAVTGTTDVTLATGHENRPTRSISNVSGNLSHQLPRPRFVVDSPTNVCRPSALDSSSTSVLTTAVETGCPVIVNIILSHCPDLQKEYNKLAMHKALLCQNKTDVPHEQHVYGEIIQSLLSYGFFIDEKDSGDPKTLYVAIRNGYAKIAAELLKHGSNRDRLRNSILSELLPLYPATLANATKLANILIKYGADENARNSMGLMPTKRSSLFRNMDLDIFKLLLTDRAAVKNNHDFLRLSVWNGHPEISKCLLRHGANVNVQDSSGRAALHFCVLRPNNPLCPISQRTRSSINADIDIIKNLVSHGADMNAQTSMGQTPLQIAAENNLVEIVKVLVELGADVNATDVRGWAALHYCAQKGNLSLSEYLLSRGAEIAPKTPKSWTALHVASDQGRLDLVQSLLEHGADLDALCDAGTPLHLACCGGRSDVVQFLVECGADVNKPELPRRPFEYDTSLMRTNAESQRFIRFFLLCHFLKMIAAGMFLSDVNTTHILQYISVGKIESGLGSGASIVPQIYLEECELEVQAMKSEKLKNSKFAWYDILVGGDVQVVELSANEKLDEIVNSNEFEQNFPHYASIIKRKYQRGKWMRPMWEKCVETLQGIFPHLPYLCVERIALHLPCSAMRRLSQSSQSTDHTFVSEEVSEMSE